MGESFPGTEKSGTETAEMRATARAAELAEEVVVSMIEGLGKARLQARELEQWVQRPAHRPQGEA